MRLPPIIHLTDQERDFLESNYRSTTSEMRIVRRSRIVLLAAERKSNQEISDRLNLSTNTIGKWRRRFIRDRLNAIIDKPGRGRKRTVNPEKIEQIVDATVTKKPQNATHWSTRSMARYSGISHNKIAQIWRANGLKPHLIRTFKLSNDKHFTEKLRDVVGLYLQPPDHSLVLCVDEKSQIQALDRTQPGLPMKKGRCGTMTHDYVRHGTCTLFAALNVLDGTIIKEITKRHRHQEYLTFLKIIDRQTPKDLDLHLIVDNYATHKHPNVRAWLEKHQRFHVHFIPTSSSWLNLVERFFGQITSERIRRGVFKSVLQLTEAIHGYIEAHNKSPKPFVWTKTANQILQKLAPLYQLKYKTT